MIANATTPPLHARSLGALKRGIQWVIGLVMDVTHSGIAFVGLTMAGLALALTVHEPLRDAAEQKVLTWLLQRQEARNDGLPLMQEPQAAERATAGSPTALPKAQANVTFWLSRKYSVAPEPLSVLVAEAFSLGQKIKLDPTLILAVMAIESRFNPFSQSTYGAQGLMQVLTRVHTDKYEDFGGTLAAFDPVTNLRVGVQVLVECIRRAGSIEGGLGLYVGAVSVDATDYVTKVMAEHVRLKDVANGKAVSVLDNRVPAPTSAMAPVAPSAPSADITKAQPSAAAGSGAESAAS